MAVSSAGSLGTAFLLPLLCPDTSSACRRVEGREELNGTDTSHLGEGAAEGSTEGSRRKNFGDMQALPMKIVNLSEPQFPHR